MIGSRACSFSPNGVSGLTVAALHWNLTSFPKSFLIFLKRNSFSIYLPYMMSKGTVENRKPPLTPSSLRRGGITQIMVFGTFDGLHKGHLNFFKQAKSLAKNSFLIVSIGRDRNVFRIKGKYPDKNEKERRALVEKCGLVDKALLAGTKDHISHIAKIRPHIIALGYDQKAYVKNLKKDLKDKGLLVKIVRLKPYKENIYKNHLLKNHHSN